MEMPGYPGIFVCVHGEGLGKVTDTRDMSKAPTVRNLLKYNCHQLKSLWITALKEQMKALEEAEGENAVTMPYLQHELEMANKFDADAGDKNFAKNKNAPFVFCVCGKQTVDSMEGLNTHFVGFCNTNKQF